MGGSVAGQGCCCTMSALLSVSFAASMFAPVRVAKVEAVTRPALPQLAAEAPAEVSWWFGGGMSGMRAPPKESVVVHRIKPCRCGSPIAVPCCPACRPMRGTTTAGATTFAWMAVTNLIRRREDTPRPTLPQLMWTLPQPLGCEHPAAAARAFSAWDQMESQAMLPNPLPRAVPAAAEDPTALTQTVTPLPPVAEATVAVVAWGKAGMARAASFGVTAVRSPAPTPRMCEWRTVPLRFGRALECIYACMQPPCTVSHVSFRRQL